MANFDITISSRLDINTAKSVTSINKTINSRAFRDQLKEVRVRLTADMTKGEAPQFRESVRKAIQTALGGTKNNVASVNVTFTVDQKQATDTLNRALQDAANQLKSIKVDIDARVDPETLQKQVNEHASRGGVSSSGGTSATNEVVKRKEREYNLTRRIGAEEQKVYRIRSQGAAQTAQNNKGLSQSAVLAQLLESRFSSSQEFQDRMNRAIQETNGNLVDQKNHATGVYTTFQNHKKDVERVRAEISLYNTELQKAEVLTANLQQNALGTWDVESTSVRDSNPEKAIESRRRAITLIEREIASNSKLVASSSQVESTLQAQNARYQQLRNSKTLTYEQAQKEIAQNRIAIIERQRETRAINLQTKLLSRHQQVLQRHSRYIEKGAMRRLRQDIEGVNLQASNSVVRLQQMEAALSGLANRASQASGSQMGVIESFNNAMLKFPIWMAASTVFFGLIRSTRTFITNIIEIDSRMVTLQKVMSDSADMNTIFDDARVSAERFGQTLKDVLDAYAEFARQGYEGADLTNFGNAALIASNVGEISAQEASEFLTAASAQWQTNSEEAMRQIDSWNDIANNYATTVEKLGEGQSKAGATARAMGLDFHETNAILGALTAQTKQSGSEIGNFIKSAFPRIYAGTGRRVLESLNIDLETASGETKNVITLLREAAFAMEELSAADQADAIRGLGGVWHYQRMQVLLETLRDTNGMYDQMLQTSRNSYGSAAAENAIYMQSLEARVNRARVAIEELSLALGEAFLESGIITFVESFTAILTKLAGTIEGFGPAVRAIGLSGIIVSIAHLARGVRNLNTALGVGMTQVLMRNIPLLGQLNASLTTTASRSRSASAALGMFKTAARGLMSMTVMGAAIAAVSFGFEKLINALAGSRVAASEAAQTMDVLKQTIESGGRDVEQLITQYERYERTIQSGQASTHVIEEHKRITEELAQLFPDLVQGNQDYGTVLASQTGLMKTRVNLIQQQIDAEERLNRVRQQEAHQANIEEARQAVDELETLFTKAQNSFASDASNLFFGSQDFLGQEFDNLLGDVIELTNAADDFEGFTKALDAARRAKIEIQQLDGISEDARAVALSDLEFFIEKFEALLGNEDLLIHSASIQKGFFSLVETKIAELQQQLDTVGVSNPQLISFFGQLSNEIAGSTDDIGQMEDTMDSLINLFIGSNSEAVVGTFNDWTKATQEFNEAASDEERYEAFLKVEETLQKLIGTMKALLLEQGYSADVVEKMTNNLEAQIMSQMGLAGATSDTINSMEDLNNVLAENTDGIEEQTEAIQSLTDALKEADKEIDTIAKALEQLNELDAIETDTLYDLLDLYPELMGMQLDAAGLEDFLNGKREEAHQRKLERYMDEIVNSKAVVEAIDADETHKLNILADAYGEDLKNFDSINEFKEKVLDGFNKYQLLENSSVLKALGEIYGVDLSNFEDLAQAKGAIEAALMAEIVELWNDYISQLDEQLKVFAKQYKGLEGMQNLLKDRQRIDLHGAGYDALGPEGQRLIQDSGITDAHREIVQLSDALEELTAKKLVLDFADISYDPATFDDIEGLIGKSLGGAGDRERDRLNRKGSSSSSTSGSSPTERELEDLNIQVERQIKTFQKQTFVLDQYEESLRQINNQLERQRIQTSSYATHSRNYRRALEEEIKLNKAKLEVMKEQEKSLAQQIKSGNIPKYGMISEDVNVFYNQYNVSGSGDGYRDTGTVKRTASNQINPFGDWRMSHNYGKRNLFPGETFHYGADFVAPIGTPIKTPHGGQVVNASFNRLAGNVVSVYNEALDKTFHFAHMLNDIPVKLGQMIQAGTTVGYLGNTGSQTTGPHLHFEVNMGRQRGINSRTAVNPLQYITSNDASWLGQTGSIRNSMSTGVADRTGQRLTAERVEYLNALEQAQLDAIEQRINAYNEGQQKLSDVHEAQMRLDQLTLDRLNLMAEIRQQMHEITLSNIEEFEVNSSMLDHRIAQLEYDAERLSRQAGETSDSAIWREYMEKAMEERAKQTAFKEEQIDFIQQVLDEDLKRTKEDRMSERSRFELEQTLRDAKEALIDLMRTEDDAVASIYQSRANQAINEIDKQMATLDRQMTAIETRRRYIDQTYDDGARAYRDTIREEIELNQERIEAMRESLVGMKNLRSELKQQPELYEQVTDKIHELEDAIEDAQATAFELNREIFTNRAEKAFESLSLGVEQAKEMFEELQHQLHFVDNELQKDIYFNLQSDVLVEMNNYKEVILENIRLLEEMSEEVKDYPELHKQVTDEIKRWKEEHRQVTRDMHTNRKQYTDAFISSIKEIYRTQQRLAIEAIDKEYTEFEKMINKRLDLLDDEKDEEDYARDIENRQEALAELRNEIAQRMGDDSLQNQARLKELREELADQEDEYNRFVADKERERRREALQQELEDAREVADERKEGINDMYDDMLNDQRKFNQIQEELMKGQVDKYKELYKDLTGFINENIQEIGKSASEGLLDSIIPPFEALMDIASLLEIVSGTDVPVPESNLLPTDRNVPDSLAEMIQGTSNTLETGMLNRILSSFNVQPVHVSDGGTNITNSIQSLVNIETYTGTQKEKDDFAKMIAEQLRKQGLVW